jgi:transcriptional regulator with XRE-family HTH domain
VTDLGRRLREARAGRFTVKQLADAAGVSAGIISEVERGRGNPSFRTLYRISRALELRIGDLFDDYPEGTTATASVVRAHQRKRLQLGEQGLVYQLLTPDLQGRLEMLLTRVSPGFSNEPDPFRHPGEECVLLLEGTLEVTVGGERYRLHQGDAITYDSGQTHWWQNPTDTEALIVGAVTPPSF